MNFCINFVIGDLHLRGGFLRVTKAIPMHTSSHDVRPSESWWHPHPVGIRLWGSPRFGPPQDGFTSTDLVQ